MQCTVSRHFNITLNLLSCLEVFLHLVDCYTNYITRELMFTDHDILEYQYITRVHQNMLMLYNVHSKYKPCLFVLGKVANPGYSMYIGLTGCSSDAGYFEGCMDDVSSHKFI